ncbi:Rv1733c family protein [Streptomyces viridiviolaceus]
MGTRVRGWRWRRNPLRRRSDVVEAWTVLAVAVLLFLGAPFLGAASAWWAHGQAQETAAAQRADRHRVSAAVVGRSPDTLPSVNTGGQHSYRATVRWSEPDGAERTTTARVPAGTRHGDVVDLWLDSRGRNVLPPMGDSAVWQHTVTIGVCSTVGAALVVLLGNCVVRRAALRHRLAEWEREWARTEPQWTHRRA